MKKKIICILLALESIVFSICSCSAMEQDISNYLTGMSTVEEATLSIFEDAGGKTEETSNDRLFIRAMERTIPSGYIESEWIEEEETPIDVLQEYTMIKNTTTNMIGVCDYDGNIVVDADYSKLSFLASIDNIPYFCATYEGKWGVINGKGKVTVPFDDAYLNNTTDRVGKNILQFIVDDQGTVNCITFDITQGEIGRFNIHPEPSNSIATGTIAFETALGPNNWVFPVMFNTIDLPYSMGIVDYYGNILNDNIEVDFGVIHKESATNDGYAKVDVIYERTNSGSIKTRYDYILDSNAKIVAGPYAYVHRYDDVFLCEGTDSEGRTITIFDPAKNQSYSADMLHQARIAGIVNNSIILYGTDEGIFTLDFINGNVFQICQDIPEEYGEEDTYDGGYDHYLSIYGENFVYMSNGTYKISDLKGNVIGESRYYGFQDTGYGALLKRENGMWVYLDENGNLSDNTNLFYGEGEKAFTYNNCEIVGYWKYKETPCVVVKEGENQVGYAL